MVIIHVLTLLLSFYFLAVITEGYFIESLDLIAKKLKLSKEAAGATFMAVGSSAPELFISFIAVMHMNGVADIGAGTIVGSAIFNILVIVGVSSMFKQATLTWQVALRDLAFYIASILMLLFSFNDGVIEIHEAFIMVMIYVIYVIAAANWKGWFRYKDVDVIEEVAEEVHKSKLARGTLMLFSKFMVSPKKNYLLTFLESVLFIGILSFIMVESAVSIAHFFSISPAIIALTVLAFGTSIPDLLSSVAVAKRGHGDMAVANAVGSNVFDILFGLGFPWLFILTINGGVVKVSTENLSSSVFLLFATVIALSFLLIFKKWKLGRYSGLLLIILYILYVIFNVLQV